MIDDNLTIRPAEPEDDLTVAELWSTCGLVTAWNPPQADIDRLRRTGHGTLLLGTLPDDGIVASAMVGHDGHRGWIYYLAVAPDHRGHGYGGRMVAAAEAWIAEQGLEKAMLMVRAANGGVEGFYRKLGYGLSAVNVLQRWLVPKPEAALSGKREVTVTHLEMTSPPVRPLTAAPSMPHAILRAHEPDPAFYRFLHDTIGREWLWYERRLVDDEALCRIIHDPAVEIFVLHIRGNPAGFIEIDRRAGEIADLRFLGLMPSFTGMGLGKYLLGWALEQAWRGATEKVTVNTCTFDHPRALPLYQRAGFEPVSRETALIDDPEPLIRRLELARAEAR